MKKFRKFTITWGIILIAIFFIFTAFSIKVDKRLKEYHSLEKTFAEAVSKYYDDNKLYPKTIEVIYVSLEEAIEKGIIEELRTKNDTCDGYVKIANEDITIFTPYITCRGYVTKGYEKELN